MPLFVSSVSSALSKFSVVATGLSVLASPFGGTAGTDESLESPTRSLNSDCLFSTELEEVVVVSWSGKALAFAGLLLPGGVFERVCSLSSVL